MKLFERHSCLLRSDWNISIGMKLLISFPPQLDGGTGVDDHPTFGDHKSVVVIQRETPSARRKNSQRHLLMRHHWWCDGNRFRSFYSFFSSAISHTVNLLLLFYTSQRDLFSQTQPIEKMQFAKSYQADRPTRRSRGLDRCQQCAVAPPPHVLHIKETRFVHPGTSRERIRLSNWFARPDWMFQLKNAGDAGGENKFLALFENSCWKYEKRVTKTDSRFHEIVNTWPFVLSRVNRFSSDRDSCHYNRIFIDRITL